MTGRHAIFDAGEWRAHGAIVPACLVGVMLVAVHNYMLGVMIGPLEKAFGWSRAEISAANIFPALMSVILAPIVGRGIDRFGPRRIALLGVPMYCAALALLGTATGQIASWWLRYALVGFAAMFVFPTLWTAAINARFDRNRGAALAIALTGTGIAGMILPMLATSILEWQGWRAAYFGIALLCFVVVFPLVYLLFDRDVPPAAIHRGTPPTRAEMLRSQMGSACFIRLAAGALLFTLATCMLTMNAVPVLIAEGLAPLRAAEIAGFCGMGTIAGRLIGGFLLDRFDARFVAMASGAGPMLGAALLLGTGSNPVAAIAACFALGIAGGTEYDVCAYLTARHFGMRNFGALFGVVGGLTVFGAGIAPVFANLIYDLRHSYDLVLWTTFPAFTLTGLLFIAIGPYPLARPEEPTGSSEGLVPAA